MPRRKKSDQPIGVGLTAKQMKRKKPINADLLRDIEPLTDNQKVLFDSYDKDQNIVAYGAAGTGKTFITLYNALTDVLDQTTPYEKIYIVRSLVATREIGFLPGDHEDKSSLYQIPYKNMVKYMFQMPSEADFEMLYANLKTQDTISFWSTSFIRGTTLDKAIIIVDEFQNLNFHELDSIITRVGEDSKIMFCGDATQTDLVKTNERNGIIDFMTILRNMPSMDIIEFGVDDIVRSQAAHHLQTSRISIKSDDISRVEERHPILLVAAESKVTIASPFDLLLPYQRGWVLDTSRFKIWLKSRQIEGSLACAFEVVADAFESGSDWIIL